MELLSLILLSISVCAFAAPSSQVSPAEVAAVAPKDAAQKDDLNTAASTNYFGANSGLGGYSGGVTGYGLLDDRYNYNGYQGGLGGYDNFGYGGYSGGGYSGGGYNNIGYSGLNKGYGGSGYGGYGSYGGYGGNGGYGGYGGNGGLTSYYGYNSPYNQGAYHLGYGYYNKRPGHGGSIYNSGVTPSLVTGYRGYTR